MANLQSHNEVYEIHRQNARRKMAEELADILGRDRDKMTQVVAQVEETVFMRATSREMYHTYLDEKVRQVR